jgi:hypothetical protein
MQRLRRALIVAAPIVGLLGLSLVRVVRTPSASAALQLLGAVCLGFVVLTHVAEATGLFPWMGWGEPHSVGHYLDVTSAVLGVTLLLTALLARFAKRVGL